VVAWVVLWEQLGRGRSGGGGHHPCAVVDQSATYRSNTRLWITTVTVTCLDNHRPPPPLSPPSPSSPPSLLLLLLLLLPLCRWDLCAGPHVERTGSISPDAFDLEAVAGAYWRGDENNAMLQVRMMGGGEGGMEGEGRKGEGRRERERCNKEADAGAPVEQGEWRGPTGGATRTMPCCRYVLRWGGGGS